MAERRNATDELGACADALIALDPTQARAYRYKALVALAGGDFDDAEDHLDEARRLGLRSRMSSVSGTGRRGEQRTYTYAGPFPSARLAVARTAVQDIELLNELARRLDLHRDAMRWSVRNNLDLSMDIISTDPDDPGVSVFKTLTPSQVFAFRKGLLEKLEALGRAAP